MEIINFFCFVLMYYFIYNLNIFVKFILFFCTTMIFSMYSNKLLIEEESKKNTNYKYKLMLYLMMFIEVTIKYLFITINWIVSLSILQPVIRIFEKINYHFVVGRNKMVTHLISNAYKTMLTTNVNLIDEKPSSTPVIEKKIVKENAKTFKDDDEMNNFLDDLVKKND